jgi:hypothetical protein
MEISMKENGKKIYHIALEKCSTEMEEHITVNGTWERSMVKE